MNFEGRRRVNEGTGEEGEMVLESGGGRAGGEGGLGRGGGGGGERCSICLEPISGEGYLDQCFHKFCYHCILQWSEMVISRPSSTSNRLQYLECPLCKTQYSSIIHDVSGGKFQRHYILTSRIPGLLKSEAHIRRQAVYSAHLGPAFPHSSRLTNVVRSIPKPNRWLSCWVQRELQALMQEEDVDTVMHHVVGIVESFSTRSKGKVSSSGRQGTKGEDLTWHATISAAVKPFIFESAERFAVELESFLVSGLDIAAYDQKSKLAACAPEPVTHSDEEITLPSVKKDIHHAYDLYDEDVDEEFGHVMVRKTSSELERFSSEERSDVMKQHVRGEDAVTQERKSPQRDSTVSRPTEKDSIKRSVKDSGRNLDRGRSKHRSESRKKRKSRSSSSTSSSPPRHKRRKRDKSVKSRIRRKRKHSKKKDKKVSQEHKRKRRKSRSRKYDHSSSDSGSDSGSSRSGRSLSPAEGSKSKARKKDETFAVKPVIGKTDNRKMPMLDVEQRTRDRRKSRRRRRSRSYEPREKSGKERPDERSPRPSRRGAQECERKGKYSNDGDGRSLSRSPERRFKTDGRSLSRSPERRFRTDGRSLSRSPGRFRTDGRSCSPGRRFRPDGRSLSRSPERRFRTDGRSLSRSLERRSRPDGRSLSPEARFRARHLSKSISPRARSGRNTWDRPGSLSPHSLLGDEYTERRVPSSEIRAQGSGVLEDVKTLETKLREQALANLMRHLSQNKFTTTSTSDGNPEEKSVVDKATQEFDAPSAIKETDPQAPSDTIRLDEGGRKDVEEGDQEGCLETDSKQGSEDADHVQALGDDAHSDAELTRPTKDNTVGKGKVYSGESRSSSEAVEEVMLEGRQLSGVSYGKATSLEGRDIVVELVVDTEPVDFEIPFRGSTGPMVIADQRGKKKHKSERELQRQGHANGIEDNFAHGESFVEQSCTLVTKSPLEAREQSVLTGNLLPCSKGSKGPSAVRSGKSLELAPESSVAETNECPNREDMAIVNHESEAIPAALICDEKDVEHTNSATLAEESTKTESTCEKTQTCLKEVSGPETSSKVREDGGEAGESDKFQQKSMSVTRGGESVQVSYKVYIPQRAAAARRRLNR